MFFYIHFSNAPANICWSPTASQSPRDSAYFHAKHGFSINQILKLPLHQQICSVEKVKNIEIACMFQPIKQSQSSGRIEFMLKKINQK